MNIGSSAPGHRYSTTTQQGTADRLDWLILFGGLITLLWWVTGEGLFYTPVGPVMSPFTSLSLCLIVGGRQAYRHLKRWPLPLTLAWIGIAMGGNIASVMVQLTVPDLFSFSFPSVVVTSVMTSVGILFFGAYEILVSVRETPETTFILDDILLLLALVPGGISLLGHLIGNSYYISQGADPRIGIAPFEMVFMATFAVASAMLNHRLFLWRFLREKRINKYIFLGLNANQFLAPIAVVLMIPAELRVTDGVGIELFVMLAGAVATLLFLAVSAKIYRVP